MTVYRWAMLRRWVAFATLGCGFALACGERFGDPIVAPPADPSTAGAPSDLSGGEAGKAEPGAGGEDALEAGPTGLCGPCLSSSSCGDANDACVRSAEETFCGRDCDEGNGCPEGYVCVELDNSRLEQCVPSLGCPDEPVTRPSLGDIRDYLLSRINAERVARGRTALDASSCLDQLAQGSAVDYARTDEPLGKFVKECDPIWPNCDCDWTGEAEVAVAHYGLDWSSAVERALGTYRDPPDDRFINSFLDFDVTTVGIGFWLSGDEAWIALSFR